MPETYPDLKSFARAFVMRHRPSSPDGRLSGEAWIEGAIELFIKGSAGKFAQRFFEQYGRYPEEIIYAETRLSIEPDNP